MTKLTRNVIWLSTIAIVCLTILDIVAMVVLRIDGKLMMFVIGAIAGLAGYKIVIQR
jgi:hypothetical protein